ncbi:hypothetical protein SAMN03159341_1414 [Paenibacillus sp. 1_12]|uniref:hypothetical protein n=1 Tax=Paenibacillus sp. 1_12 TaxID=1566278 RepID=UPI0008EEAF07|nr:hypothetical protein [Paenibacillus sp. 1_12]SFM51305.1 hypothetical protein SAMN03159341_1414 [Paenibacillus sp. 1_12]
MKKISMMLVLSLVISLFSSLTALAESGAKVETKQGGYVSISNVTDKKRFTDEGSGVGDSIFVSDKPVTLTITGKDSHPSINFLPDAKLVGESFIMGEASEDITVKEYTLSLSKKGYYGVNVRFGSEFSPDTVAEFVVQITGEATAGNDLKANSESGNNAVDQGMSTVNVLNENSGYTIKFPSSSLRLQKVKGSDDEIGGFEVSAITLKNPEFEKDSNVFLFDLVTTNPKAHSVYVSVDSYFGGQMKYVDEEFKDGKVSVFMPSVTFKSVMTDDVLDVIIEVYDKDRNVIDSFKNIYFMYEGFNRYKVSDADTNQSNKPVSAKPTASKVIVNGKQVSFEAYNINNNNFFKLRDIASVVNGTEKQFEVKWDGAKNAISLLSGKAYTPAGGELKVSAKPVTKEAKPTTSTLYIDGKEVNFVAYTIDGNNYFKLRDIAKAFNIGVTWDSAINNIGIDTKLDYKEE